MNIYGPFISLPKKAVCGKTDLRWQKDLVSVFSLSPDVITTHSGMPPPELEVLTIKVGQLYLSRFAVLSSKFRQLDVALCEHVPLMVCIWLAQEVYLHCS